MFASRRLMAHKSRYHNISTYAFSAPGGATKFQCHIEVGVLRYIYIKMVSFSQVTHYLRLVDTAGSRTASRHLILSTPAIRPFPRTNLILDCPRHQLAALKLCCYAS